MRCGSPRESKPMEASRSKTESTKQKAEITRGVLVEIKAAPGPVSSFFIALALIAVI